MGDFTNDKRIVLTLDAGGTNFVFSAVQAREEIIDPIILSARGENLDAILKTIMDGFRQAQSKVTERPVAISFAFPGPADYENGIIGDLQNLPLFRGGVALGPMLSEQFGMPVFINNDGDLFAYGEAIGGLLPEINRQLEEAGNPKRYRNLIGVTFGTGFGGGIVSRDGLLFGDNSAGGEINRIRSRTYKNFDAEDSVSIRGIRRAYAILTGVNMASVPEPKDLFKIGTGEKPGNRQAAVQAFESFAIDAADAIANAVTLIDGLVVIGGGLSGAWPLFLPKMTEEMNRPFLTADGGSVPRLETNAFNLEDPQQLFSFLQPTAVEIQVPFSEKKALYDPRKKVGLGISRLGTSKAVSVGAYAFALSELDKMHLQ